MTSVFEGLHFTPGEFEGLNFTPAVTQPSRPQGARPELEEVETNDGLEGVDFTPYEPPQQDGLPKRFGKKVGRGAGRTVARATEAVLGLPGDVRDFVQGLGQKGLSYIIGEEKAAKAGEFGKKVQSFTGAGLLPTSREIRENVTQYLTKEGLEPQTPGEEVYDEFIGDLATLALPIKAKIPFARAIGTAVFGNLGKEMVKELGIGEKGQTATKLGIMLIYGALGRGGARNYVSDLHKEAAELIPKDATIDGRKLITNLDKMQSILKKGGITPSKSPTLSLSRQLINKIQKSGGELPVDELPAFRRSINEMRFDKNLNPKARFHLNRFDDVVSNQLLEYGKENPAFLNKYRAANLGSAGLAQSNKIAQAISKKVDITRLSPDTLLLLGLHMPNPGLLAGIGVTAIGAKGAQIAKRLTTNKVLQKYYTNVVKSSLEGNTATMVRNVEGLDREMRKTEKKK